MTCPSWSTGTTAAIARSGAGTTRSTARLRAAAAIALARASELGCEAPQAGPDAADLEATLEQAERLLGAALSGGRAPAPRADLVALLASVSKLRRELRADGPQRRLLAIAEVCDGLARLRGAGEPGELLDRLPEEVCRSCAVDRAVVARVQGGQWTVAQAHFTGDPAGTQSYVEQLAGRPLSIALAPLEADIIRRRAAVLAHEPMLSDSGIPASLSSYAAAPVVVGERVTAIVYAGRTTSAADELDRDALRWLADGVGDLWERAALTQRLRLQRDHVREMVSTATVVLTELCDAGIDLQAGSPARDPSPLSKARRQPLADLITRRELEVLALMSEGVSNAVIAERLVVAEGTVKSHVKHILRKLSAANRAEVVARYLHQDIGDQHDLQLV